MINEEYATDSKGEFKVLVDGVDRYVSGVTEHTSCAEIIYALAHSMSKRGKFVLVMRDDNGQTRTFAPNERPWAIDHRDNEFELREIDDITAYLENTGVAHMRTAENDGKKTGPPPTYHDFIRQRHSSHRSATSCGLELEYAMASAFANDNESKDDEIGTFIGSLKLTRTELEILLQSQSEAIGEQKQYMASLDHSLELQHNDHLEYMQLMRQHANLRTVLNAMRAEDWPNQYRSELEKNKSLVKELEDLKNELVTINTSIESTHVECDKLKHKIKLGDEGLLEGLSPEDILADDGSLNDIQ